MVKDNIICIFEVGSQLFFKNTKDKDYLVVVKDGTKENHIERLEGIDLFIMEESEFKRYLEGDHPRSYVNIVCTRKPIYGECPYEFDWFAVKDKAIQRCLRAFFMDPRVSIGRKYCSPHIMWALWILYAIINKSTELRDTQLETIAKAHNGHLPREYQSKVRDALVQILNEEEA